MERPGCFQFEILSCRLSSDPALEQTGSFQSLWVGMPWLRCSITVYWINSVFLEAIVKEKTSKKYPYRASSTSMQIWIVLLCVPFSNFSLSTYMDFMGLLWGFPQCPPALSWSLRESNHPLVLSPLPLLFLFSVSPLLSSPLPTQHPLLNGFTEQKIFQTKLRVYCHLQWCFTQQAFLLTLIHCLFLCWCPWHHHVHGLSIWIFILTQSFSILVFLISSFHIVDGAAVQWVLLSQFQD